MTAETERTGPAQAAPGDTSRGAQGWRKARVPRRSWGRSALRALIMAVAFVALVGFAAVLAEMTLTPSPVSADIAGSNLRPGHSLMQYAEDYTFLAACKQIGGNLLMGAPFGVILPLLMPRRLRMLRVLVVTAVVMALVELAQGAMVEGRAFDIDDVILNTSGALIAYLLLGRWVSRRFHMLNEPEAEPQPEPGSGPGSGKPKVSVAKPAVPLSARLRRLRPGRRPAPPRP
ncbi:VanZ family protein [Streptomyces sp. JV176]|uniref:VanZ family protein n=1 Tax=Streptomyces sp. JV176 TaxID=858630 RepID=UPI002E7651CE|nr:VanZ family protein [Streptomyces sp. JV176]